MLFFRRAVSSLLLVSAVALHVLNETVTGFLPFYNQSVLNLRAKLGFFPFPVFSFGLWLGGLIAVILICYLLTPFVTRGGRVIRIITIVPGILMVINALSHILGSLYLGKIVPGTLSSPVLLASAVYYIVLTVKN